MNLFSCMLRPTESPKSTSPLVANTPDHHHNHHNNNNNNNSNSHSHSNGHQANVHIPTSTNGPGTVTKKSPNHHQIEDASLQSVPPINLLRYVKVDFLAVMEDEVSVSAGDVVLYISTYSDEKNGDWTHILRWKTNEQGFVPSKILSTDPSQTVHKKKLPRSRAESTENQSSIQQIQHHHHDRINHTNHQHHQQHHNNRSKTMTTTAPPLFPFLDDNIHLTPGGCQHSHNFEHHGAIQRGEQAKKLSISHSLQDSSGRQTSCKCNDFKVPICPQYGNLPSSDCIVDYALFKKYNYGLFVVIYNFVAREENDLNARPGEYVELLNRDDPDWYWVRRLDDRSEGFIPAKFIYIMQYYPAPSREATMDSMMLWGRLLRLENLVLDQAREIDRLKLLLLEDYEPNNQIETGQQNSLQHQNASQEQAVCPQHRHQQQAESMLLDHNFAINQGNNGLASLSNLKSAIHPTSAIPPVMARPHTTNVGLMSPSYATNIRARTQYATTANVGFNRPSSGQINWPPTKYAGFKSGELSTLDDTDDFGQESHPKKRKRKRSTLQELLTCFSPCFGI